MIKRFSDSAFRRRWERFCMICTCLMLVWTLWACASDETGNASLGDSDASENEKEIVPYVPAAVTARFEPAKLAEDFYAVPFPNDLLLDASGVPDLSAFPNPHELAYIEDFKEMASYRRVGWHQSPVCLFVFDGAIETQTLPEDPYAFSDESSPVQLVDITKGSPTYGQRLPLLWQVDEDADFYQPGHLLAVMPYYGYVLREDTTYACMVTDSLKDINGQAVGPDESMYRLMQGQTSGTMEERVLEVYDPLWRYLLENKDFSPVSAAVFTTGHTAKWFKELYDDVVSRERALLAEPFRQTRETERYLVLEGMADVPIFREGEPPYNEKGRMFFDSKGCAVVQHRELAPIALSIPRSPMPSDGYPLVVYIHGSNGLSTQNIDRGPVKEPGGEREKNLGPAHELAPVGIATASMALPMNPERFEPYFYDAYQNLSNIPSIIGQYQQAVVERGLLLNLLESLELDTKEIIGYSGNESRIRFDFEQGIMAMGQSQGGMTLSLWAPLEPRIRALAPSGVGGIYTLIFFLIDNPPVGPLLDMLLNVGNEQLNERHPILTLLQMGLEHIDPIVTLPHLVKEPFGGMQPKHLYHPAGYVDSYFPPDSITAWTLAVGADLAGERIYPELFKHVEQSGGCQKEYPVFGNRSIEKESVTAVVVQYPEDGIADGHHINFQLDEPKFQYRCFFKSFIETGLPVVVDPETPSRDCP